MVVFAGEEENRSCFTVYIWYVSSLLRALRVVIRALGHRWGIANEYIILVLGRS